MVVKFPDIEPTSRSYNPGVYAQTEFKALNGSTTVLRYGNKRSDSELRLGFANITDSEAAAIIKNYELVNSTWDYVQFSTHNGLIDNALIGINSDSLAAYVAENAGGRKWRYAEPPSVTSVVPGRSSVQCRFQAFLDP